MADDDNGPGPKARPAGRVNLPPSGLAQDILRQMAVPEGPAPAAEPGRPASRPSLDLAEERRQRESLLQFADAVMNDPAGTSAAPLPEPDEHLVTFFLQREEYGVPVLRSREIVRVGDITRIPEAPPHIRGVFNLRGRLIPIVDLSTRLGLVAAPLTGRSRLILVEAYGRVLALLVDSVSRLTRVPASALRPPPAEALSARTDYVSAVAQMGERLIILLDLDRVLLLVPEQQRGAPLGGVNP